MNKVTPDLPLHRAHLRRALLASKPEGSNYSFMKKLLPVGLVLALLLMFNAVQKPDSAIQITPKASAQEFFNDVLTRVQELTPEELAALEAKLGGGWFEEARGASDLTYVELEKKACEPEIMATDPYCLIYDYSTPLGGTVGMQSHTQEEQALYDSCVALQYTSSDGAHVTLLVDPELNPLVAFYSYDNPEDLFQHFEDLP